MSFNRLHRYFIPISLWVFCCATVGEEPGIVSYEGYKLVQVEVEYPEQISRIEKTGAVILNCIPAPGPIDLVANDNQLKQIEGLVKREVHVRHTNVQELITRDKPKGLRDDPFDDFFLDYHDYDDGTGSIVWYMNELVSRYPGLASMVNVGTTYEGDTIWGLRVSNSAAGEMPAVVYFGAEHAREWIASTIPTYVATYLLQNYGIDPDITDLVDNVEFFLIPVMNVDGYEYTWSTDRFWRKNRRNNGDGSYGVDLNRNWGEGWGGAGSSGDPSDDLYRGPSPFSEPETQEMRDFFINHDNVRAQIDIHSYSQLILWPFGYTSTLPDDQSIYLDIGGAMQSLIHDVHGRTYAMGPIYSAIYPASGGSLDWTYAQLGILSYSFELRPTSGSFDGFELPPDQIIPNNEEILPAILHLSQSDWVRSPVRFDYTDGPPAFIASGEPAPITVTITPQYDEPSPSTAKLFHRNYPGQAFSEIPLTYLGHSNYEVALPATNCLSAPEFYIELETVGNRTVTSPPGAPQETFEATMAPVVFNLSEEPSGWTMQGLWDWGTPTGSGGSYGNPDPVSGHTGSAVFGYNLNGDYPNDMLAQHLTSPPINCSQLSNVHLRFWRWLGVEEPQYDHASVSVSNNGTNWITVWQNSETITDDSWTLVDYDISLAADGNATVYLRWTMGSSDPGWTYCGWNIDDIALTANCVPTPGDFDGSGLVDIADVPAFADCLGGPGSIATPWCDIFDLNDDEAVDLLDFAFLQGVFQ